MNSLETIKEQLLAQKALIESLGGTVNVANTNPSPSEITAGIATIVSDTDSVVALMGDTTKSFNNSLITHATTFKSYCFNTLGGALSGHVDIPEGITTLPIYCFAETNVESYSCPSTLNTIRRNCFSNCANLKHGIIPDSVTSLESNMFYNSENLETLYIGTGITSLVSNICKIIPKVKTFTLPANIVEIKTSNFVNILEMEDFYVKGSAVTAIDSNIFNTHSSSLRLWVPFEGLNYYYSATNWAKMNSYMIAEKEIAEGETFPTIDYSLNWYATILDATNNTNILTSPTGAGTYYCKFVIS